jgi:hypothetical protein
MIAMKLQKSDVVLGWRKPCSGAPPPRPALAATRATPYLGPSGELSPQLTAFFTSAPTLASSAAVNSFSAKAIGHMTPSSRFATSLKPSIMYPSLNFCPLRKKQTTLPSLLAFAGIPYEVFGESWCAKEDYRNDIIGTFTTTNLRLLHVNQIAIRVLKAKPLYT